MIDQETIDQLEKFRIQGNRISEIQAELISKNPNLPEITSIIIATDMESAERVWAELEKTKDFNSLYRFIGSYSKIDFAYRAYEAGFITKERLYQFFVELWPSSDPDDTDPRFLATWIAAWKANKSQPLYDDPKKPLPDQKTFTIYRGQRESDTSIGIAWSLTENIARRFARGASFRVPIADGILYKARIDRKHILAYLTDRGEEEVIVNPFYLK